MTVWVNRITVERVHGEQLTEHGGALGLRDAALLESALARPLDHAGYGKPDIAELGAMYAIAIARNHPFVDGNKRAGFMTMVLFLALNGMPLEAPDADTIVAMLDMAAGELSDLECTAWVRDHAKPSIDEGRHRRHIRLMTDPFVDPSEPTAAEAIEAIGEELGVFDDWMDRYQFIIELGRKLPPLPPDWMNDAHRVPGCQSKVWMEAAMQGPVLRLAGASDAAIVSGLVALLLRVYSGRAPAEVLATDPVFLRDLGLLEALSTNRGNGIAAMARAIRSAADAEMRRMEQ